MLKTMAAAKDANGEKYMFAGADGVHPTPNGHLVMAAAFLKALGLDGAVGTITVDLAANTATGTPGQKVLSCQNGTVSLESTVYPFCLSDDGTPKDKSTVSVLPFFPFNDELNRYELIVTGLKGKSAKVTWGGDAKTFSAEKLAKGVNLAAEFLKNPFAGPFAKVDAAVRAQQAAETTIVKQLLHALPNFKMLLPDQAANLDQLAQAGLAKDQALFAAAQAAVAPVQHTITIEAGP
jgi:hypothetical protein